MHSSIFIQSSIQNLDNLNLDSYMTSEEDVMRLLQKDQLEYFHTTESEEDEEEDQQFSDDEQSIVGNVLEDLETEQKNQLAQSICFEIEFRKKRKFWHTNQWKVLQKESQFLFRLGKNNYKINRQKCYILFKSKSNAF